MLHADSSGNHRSGRIRVAHLITSLDVGGAETMLRRLLVASDHQRFAHMVFSLSARSTLDCAIERIPVRVIRLDVRGPTSAARGLLRLIRALRMFRPHVLQTWLYHADLLGSLACPFVRGMTVAWNLRRSGVALGDLSLGTWLIVRVLARLSRVPDVVMVNSEAGRLAHLGIGYRPRRWEVVFNGFDTSLLKRDIDARSAVRDQLRLPREIPVIGLVARYHAAKDHGNFIRAAMLIGARHESVHFVLVGRSITPNNRALACLIHASGFGHRFHLLGEREDIARLTASFDIACSSSITEGFANTIGEAMACGVPCVATAVGDSATLLGDGGFTVPPGDPIALSEACCRLLAMRPDERAGIGARGRARISAEFSLEQAVARYEGVYAELAQR